MGVGCGRLKPEEVRRGEPGARRLRRHHVEDQARRRQDDHVFGDAAGQHARVLLAARGPRVAGPPRGDVECSTVERSIISRNGRLQVGLL